MYIMLAVKSTRPVAINFGRNLALTTHRQYCILAQCALTCSVPVSQFLTLLLVNAKFDLSVENPTVFGAEDFKIDGWVVAAHFTPAAYLPLRCDMLCVILRDALLLQELRYEESYFRRWCSDIWND